MSIQTELEQGICDQASVAVAVEHFITNIVAQLLSSDDITETADKARAVASALSGDSIRFAKLIEQRPATPVAPEA